MAPNGAGREFDVHMFQPQPLVPPEDDMQQALAALPVDQLIALIWDEMERRGLRSYPLFRYLYHKLQRIEFYEMMNAIWAKAWNELEAVRTECHTAFREEHSWLPDSTFYNGEDHSWLPDSTFYNGSGATVYRVLVPLRLAVQVFKNADQAHFYEKGTARCLVDDYHGPDKPRVVRVQVVVDPWTGVQCRFVEFGLSRTEDKAAAAATGVGLLEVRAVELGLDYTKQDTRFMLRRPASQDIGRQFLQGWAKVLESTKLAQMQAEDAHLWPREDQRPWMIKDLNTMPVALWVSRKQQDHSYCGRARDGGDGYEAAV